MATPNRTSQKEKKKKQDMLGKQISSEMHA